MIRIYRKDGQDEEYWNYNVRRKEENSEIKQLEEEQENWERVRTAGYENFT